MAPCLPDNSLWENAGERYRRDREYRVRKRELTTALLAAAERALGPLTDHITHIEAATPLSQQRYTLSTDGTPYGLADWGGMARRPDTATAVSGLHVVGQNTRFGSGVAGAAVSGIACAGNILGRDLLLEVYRGAVLADPLRLPGRSQDWDPLAVSRGRARRDNLGLPKLTLIHRDPAVP